MTAMGAAESVSTLETAGFLAAAGDSWFDYPFHDVLKMLDDDFGYNVESSAHRGDPIERMAYQGGQLEDFARKLEKIQAQGATPKAVCFPVAVTIWRATSSACCSTTSIHLSAAGTKKCCRVCSRTEFQPLTRKCSAASQSFARGCFRRWYRFWCMGTIIRVPDGRGFLGGWPFPGPWLEPGFRQKNFEDLDQRISMMMDVMDRFNKLVSGLSKSPGLEHVCYIDLRGTLSNKPANYKLWWANELHPTEDGFMAVTKKFVAVLQTLP
jgi:hypothetical protein